MENKRILVVAPHTDDGELGCGGTIAKLIEAGNEVQYVAFSTAGKSIINGQRIDVLETEVRAATKQLGILTKDLRIYRYEVRKLNYVRQEILDELIFIKMDFQPQIVFIPLLTDLHQDHQTVAAECLRAFKNICLLGYELPWNNMGFNAQAFVTITADQLDTKVRAMGEYKSQSHRDYCRPEFIRSLAITRGVQIGVDYAEAFEVIRWIM